ncbi:MAG: hypothetical protein EU539_09780 [Promethearchaeota archaeon]|nr:MAG: hypothetical protein EU539_09780 [Candidatus Lokiarchaeota archaeon]
MNKKEISIKEVNNQDSNTLIDPYLRIHSIDFLKGFSVCVIIILNFGKIWLDSEEISAFLSVYLDVLGIPLFTFLSCITVIFWWKKKMGINPDKAIRNEILSRALILISLGMIYNLFTIKKVPFPINLWGWNMLMFIGMAYVICYYSIRLSRGARWVIGFVIFFITTPIREFLYLTKNNHFIFHALHFILVSPNPEMCFLPYAAFCFFSTIFGERLLEALLLENKKAYLDTVRAFMTFGIIFTLISIYFGYGFVTSEILDPSEYPTIKNVTILQHESWKISGIPGLFIRGTAPNLFYSLGVSLFILGLIIYVIDMKKIDVRNYIVKTFCFYGNVSLTIFIIHFIGLIFLTNQISIFIFIPSIFIYLILIGIIMHLWVKYGKGVGTLEWILSKKLFLKKIQI